LCKRCVVEFKIIKLKFIGPHYSEEGGNMYLESFKMFLQGLEA